ncbi:MAG: hypothetical protein CYPHOPRED_005128 [Cyphobasidiales sp. Tagirdzhanova-0007]|nr:MAG: hypothetical protein CYPHOPRED_005128 [Cyphobasidiales sp. Tagirdzhanova-0007]
MASFSHGPMRGLLSDLDTRNKWNILRGSESLISGAGAGLVSSIVTCPLDVVKTRLQARGGMLHVGSVGSVDGLVGILNGIYRSDGLKGLYTGLAPTIYGYLPTWAIYFTVYDRVKASLTAKRGISNAQQSPLIHVTAAMTGGAVGTVITNPLWTQSLDPQRTRYRHTIDAVRQIYQNEGLRAFYKGLVPSLFGITHVAVQFPLYEKLKSLNQQGNEQLPSHKILFCSSFSKAIASITTYPHEVVRTRLQIQRSSRPPGPTETSTRLPHRGIADVIRQIGREEGFRGFYRGLGVNLIRTVPSAALTILTYELLMRNLHKLTYPEPNVDTDHPDESH